MADLDALIAQARLAPHDFRQEFGERLTARPTDDEAASLHLAIGWAAHTQGDFEAAHQAAVNVRRLRDEGDTSIPLAQIFRLESSTLIEQGRYGEAQAMINNQIARAADLELPILHTILGTIHYQSGEFEQALAAIDLGFAEAQRLGDRASELRLLNNRAVISLEMGDFAAARQGLEARLSAADRAAYPHENASSTHNLGVVEARIGNLPVALDLFQDAARQLTGSNDRAFLAHSLLDQSKLLFDAGLLDESYAAANRSREIFEMLCSGPSVVEVSVQLSRICAAQGDWHAASAAAQAAVDRGTKDGLLNRHVASARSLLDWCSLVLLASDAQAPPPSVWAMAGEHPDLAVDIGFLLAQNYQQEQAGLCLSAVQAQADSPTMARLNQAVAEAKLAAMAGALEDARNAVARGLAIASDYAIALGISELRMMTSRRVQQLCDIGVEIESQAQAPTAIVELLEHVRSIAMAPEPNIEMDELSLLSKIRSLARLLSESTHLPQDRLALIRNRNEFERQLRDRRRMRGASADSRVERDRPSNLPLPSLHFFCHKGTLRVIARENGRVEEHAVGEAKRIRKSLMGLRLTLSALSTGSPQSTLDRPLASVRSQLASVIAILDRHENMIVVPEPTLGTMPWALLTTSAVSLAPTLALAAAAKGATRRGVTVAVAGPDLAGAPLEAAAVGAAYGDGAIVLDGAAATAEGVLNLWASADLVHFACHGVFRSDNPLYSRLQLADGPITFFDLLQVRAPARVIFSSCDVGRSAATSSVGLASLLLARGCEAMVASTGPANDEAAVALMTQMHSELNDGLSVAQALRRAQASMVTLEPSTALFAAYGLG